jgi:tetratricopeptide (TPR) repeat protein
VDDQQLFQIQSLVAKANALYHAGKYQQAYDLLTNAIHASTASLKSLSEIGPSGKMLLSNLYNRRAATANKLGNHQQVLSDATEVVLLGFQREKGHVRRGGALLGLGRPVEACEEYNAALALNPGNAAYRQYLREAEAAAGGLPVAPATPESPPPDVDVAPCPAEVERQSRIQETLKKGNKVFFAPEPDYIEALTHYDSALRHLDHATAPDGDKVAAVTRHQLLSRRAQTLHQLTRFQEAIDDAEQMIRMAPHSEKGYLLKANAYICLAQHTLEQGVRHMPTPERRQTLQRHMNALEAASFA